MGIESRLGEFVRYGALAVLLSTLVTSSIPAAAEVAEDLASADAAFEAGDHPRALDLYEKILIREPGNVPALVRSAQMLSWEKRYDEAIRRYDLVIVAVPGHRLARLERAKVLSWSGRYEAAAEGFRGLLAESPSDREARLGLARSLSWSGRQTEARREYERVLGGDSRDADALLGVAQTRAWSGETRQARTAYEEALAASPRMKDAEIGLGWLDLGDGDPYAAASRARVLAEAHPGDEDVAELAVAARRARAPWIRVSYDRVDDRDRISANVGRVEGGLGLPRRMDLRAGVARWDLASPAPPDGTIDSLWAALGWTPRRRHRLEGRAGVDRTEDSLGVADSSMIGGLSYGFPVAATWSGRIAWDRDTFRYSPAILDDRIEIDAYSAAVEGRVGDRWRVGAGAGLWDLSDGNGRKSLDAGAWFAFKPAPVVIETGYQFRGRDYDRDTKPDSAMPTSYFSPDGLTAHAIQARARGPLRSSRRGTWEAGAEVGLQSFTRNGVKTSNDVFFGVDASIGVPIGSAVILEIHGATSSYAQQGGGDWRFRQLGLRLRWTIGG